jgi:hypothetical protein
MDLIPTKQNKTNYLPSWIDVQEHDLKHPGSVDLIPTTQNKLPSFMDRCPRTVLESQYPLNTIPTSTCYFTRYQTQGCYFGQVFVKRGVCCNFTSDKRANLCTWLIIPGPMCVETTDTQAVP